MPIWKHLLWPAAAIWWLASALRNWLYNSEFLNGAEFEVPVISIGNLSMGGSGKTPMTEYFLYRFRDTFRTAVISRGYKRRTTGFRLAKPGDNYTAIGDEPRQISAKFRDTPVAVSENRALAIPQLLSQMPDIQLILMDDGYQHRSVRPAMNILLTPYYEPFWNDRIFPVGWLRESKSNYGRADVIIVTRCPAELSPEDENQLRQQCSPQKHQKLFFSTLRYGVPYSLFVPQTRKQLTPASKVFLFTGIANGKELKEYIASRAGEVFWMEFADHYDYEQEDISDIIRTVTELNDPDLMIITTEKDAVRLEPFRERILSEGITIHCLPVMVEFTGSNKDEFDNLVAGFINYYRSGEPGVSKDS